MADTVADLLERWTRVGLIDEQTAERIRTYELTNVRPAALGWSVRIALAFGALLLAAGTLLFVSAHWDAMSPGARFGLVTLLVAGFHAAAALVADRFPKMATTLHAVGTVALGAGIFLAGQIFNLDEHWPGGVMMWAAGAAIAWALLGDWPQLALVALLVPAWLTSEWAVAVTAGPSLWTSTHVVEAGLFLLALAYFTAARSDRVDVRTTTLHYIGRVALLPAALSLALVPLNISPAYHAPAQGYLWTLGWAAAIGLPLGLAILCRRTEAWPNALAVVWVLVFLGVHPSARSVFLYAWWALGSTALAAWGVRDARGERITMGLVMFAITVLAFYFSQVMDKLGRSESLVGFGLLFLATGWTLDRTRRRLIVRMQGGVA